MLRIVQSVGEYRWEDTLARTGVDLADLRIPPARLFSLVTAIDRHRTPRGTGVPAVVRRAPGWRGSAVDPGVRLNGRRTPVNLTTLGRPWVLWKVSPAVP